MTFQLMQELVVVRKAHQLTLEIYRITGGFPTHEQFGLTSQLRRAAASVPTNICEGKGRRTDADLARFLLIAKGSLLETQYLLTLSRDLEYISGAQHEGLHRQAIEVERMIAGMLANARVYPALTFRRAPKPNPKK